MPIHLHRAQKNILEGAEQHSHRRTLSRPLGIARIQPSQFFSRFHLLTACPMLHQCQNARPKRKQTRQPRCMLVVLQIHRCQRKRFPFQASKIGFDQVFFPIRQHGLFQRQPFLPSIDDVHAPSRQTKGSLNGQRISLHPHPKLALLMDFRCPFAILAHPPLVH